MGVTAGVVAAQNKTVHIRSEIHAQRRTLLSKEMWVMGLTGVVAAMNKTVHC